MKNDENILKTMESWSQESEFKFVLKVTPEQPMFTNMVDFLQSLLLREESNFDFEDNVLNSSIKSLNETSSSENSEVSSVNSDSFLYPPLLLKTLDMQTLRKITSHLS